jgi:hypothetical protein
VPTETVEFRSDPQIVIGPDGSLQKLVVIGTAELTRGPLGRFIDLAAEIEAEGLEVPAEISEVLHHLTEGI